MEPRPNSQALYQLEPQPQPVLLAAQRGWLPQASLVCVQRHLLRKAVFGSLMLNLWLTLSIFFTRSTVCSLPQLTLLPAKCKPDWTLHDGTVTRHIFFTACSSVLEISQSVLMQADAEWFDDRLNVMLEMMFPRMHVFCLLFDSFVL